MKATKWVRAASLLVCLGYAYPEERQNQDEAAVLELGTAPGRNLGDRVSSFGPTVAVEFSPIEKWLEIEAGVTPSFGHRTTEWATDLLFKKPWTLSPKVGFMIGMGPEWLHTTEAGFSRNSLGGEAALDFMFWPGRSHRFGWYLEPGYEYNFGRGHERSIGMSVGLLIAIPKH